MSSDLSARIETLFEGALLGTVRHPSLSTLHRCIEAAHRQLGQPMRVAIVGLIKAGKSTLMNALLGQPVVPTGAMETTFNVNWLKWGESPSLRVHFKDARPPEATSFDELEGLTRHADADRERLLGIRYVEVFYPSPMLKRFHLIDTPGLASFIKVDSQNTEAFLKGLSDATHAQAAGADAVLYLFSRSVHAWDQSAIEEFLGLAAGHTPINTIGVLTKVELSWQPPEIEDPIQAAGQLASGLQQRPDVQRLFHRLCPTAGLLGLGSQSLTAGEFEILRELAALPDKEYARFERIVRNVQKFATEYVDFPVDVSRRRQVAARLGLYGVWLGCDLLLRGGITTREQLMRALFERSGVPQLQELIHSHFGNRALLIKLDNALRTVERCCFEEKHRQSGEALAVVRKVASDFQTLGMQEHAFSELRVLRDHYDGHLDLDADERRQLLTVTGESGTSLAARLELPEGATVPEMMARCMERLRHWQLRAHGLSPHGRATVNAIRVLTRSYERILTRLEQVNELLYL